MSDTVIQMPDVNTLIAVAWPNHMHHQTARRWMRRATEIGWATCTMVQSGFIRVSMNPQAVGQAADFATAAAILERYTSDPGHTLWEVGAPPVRWPDWLRHRLQGYRQVTDATLVATVLENDGVLATLDAGILTLVPEEYRSRVHVIGTDEIGEDPSGAPD